MIKIQSAQLSYLWKVSKHQHHRILMSCVVGVVSVALSLSFIYSSKLVIDIASGSGSGSLYTVGFYTCLLLFAQIGCDAISTLIDTKMQQEVGNDLRHRLFERVLYSRWNELERFHTGDVVNRMEQDTHAIVTLLTSSIPAVFIAVIQFTAAFVFFCSLDSSLPWLLVVLLPAGLFASRFYLRKMKKYTKVIRESDSNIQAVIQESLLHRTVIKTLEHCERHIGKLDLLQHTLREQIYGRMHFSLFTRLVASFAFSGGYLVAFLWGAVRLSTGSITFGSMTAFLQLVGQIQQPALGLSRLLPTFVNALAAVDRLQELEQLPGEIRGEGLLLKDVPDIVLERVSFAYAEGQRQIFDSFSVVFPAGSCTAVLGETGAGKTTLVRLLLALADPQKGQLQLKCGEQLIPIAANTRSNFVYVPQGNTLFSGTIRDNLLMGNPHATQAEMESALRTAVADYVFDLPEGIDTPLNEQGGGLSEGQAQRIAIARSLLRPGTILLMDEATSGLDPATERQLLHNLFKDYAGRTFIFITHHPALAEVCEYKVCLS